VLVAALWDHITWYLGLLTLVQQYLSYSSLGLQYAVNVELSTADSTDAERRGLFIGSSFAAMTVISGFSL